MSIRLALGVALTVCAVLTLAAASSAATPVALDRAAGDCLSKPPGAALENEVNPCSAAGRVNQGCETDSPFSRASALARRAGAAST